MGWDCVGGLRCADGEPPVSSEAITGAHAHGGHACLRAYRLPHARAMAGSPLKRMRKAGVTHPVTGELIPFPYMPRVAELPPGWRHFTTAQKIDHLIGLDRAAEILSWGPITELDPLRQSFQMQVLRVFLLIGLKAVLDGTLAREATRERDRERILEELARGFEEHAARGA